MDESSKDEGAIESAEVEEETSLEERKSLLVGVQQTLLDMQTENRRMAAELTDLKSSFNKHSTEISSLKNALNKALDDNDKLKQSLDSLKKKVQERERNINELYGQQDDLEQYTRLKYTVFQKICILQRMTWLNQARRTIKCSHHERRH